MEGTIVIHAHDPSEGPGERWWAESDAGFVGGNSNLNELVKHAVEWAEEAGIEPRFRFEDAAMEAYAPEQPRQPTLDPTPYSRAAIQ